ncbi:50S ribosomal protein L24 [Carboxydothermus hydrogenoformans]|uniref:Large ribosomal subunit protein uL24 n=1 Tax=Carboxydothermus hydrogenoformans (strain ATCC BAA-161 / DSM 6008 / Z-2901) TaxID=246194 RepID=RL24_CARHZ|nr:50S ribosomal protein L24 [Carboxydothermus hydrogenoformans]Q3A9S7.1 RecName: Full=Large ribosomal subunit protein uL24; AltName: Full=50S ribosomal protein L24 [Carboxydothermus hydrogenoformans Z-2901]ABB14726.1 ribosomal protein L24 [Carboxydothermus hydrogenoformans Z-2901]
MPKLKVKKGDMVLVIAGKDKDKKGKIVQVLPKENRVVVEGVNIVKRHTRPNPKLPQGGIVEKEAPIHVSNVMVICPSCGKPTRVGKKFLADGKKIRVCKKCGESLDR